MILKIDEAKETLKIELQDWLSSMKTHFENIPINLNEQLVLLENIRAKNYEQLNQIQHALGIISAAETLQIEFPLIDLWTWHPKQTSDVDFADLTGYANEEIILNAEITTSLKPLGTIDIHMKTTLESLNRKAGKKFYFVKNEVMKNRALTKISKNAWSIEARILVTENSLSS